MFGGVASAAVASVAPVAPVAPVAAGRHHGSRQNGVRDVRGDETEEEVKDDTTDVRRWIVIRIRKLTKSKFRF